MQISLICTGCRVHRKNDNFIGFPIFVRDDEEQLRCPNCGKSSSLHDAETFIAAWHRAYTAAKIVHELEHDQITSTILTIDEEE